MIKTAVVVVAAVAAKARAKDRDKDRGRGVTMVTASRPVTSRSLIRGPTPGRFPGPPRDRSIRRRSTAT